MDYTSGNRDCLWLVDQPTDRAEPAEIFEDQSVLPAAWGSLRQKQPTGRLWRRRRDL